MVLLLTCRDSLELLSSLLLPSDALGCCQWTGQGENTFLWRLQWDGSSEDCGGRLATLGRKGSRDPTQQGRPTLAGVELFKKEKYDLIIVDTSGRHKHLGKNRERSWNQQKQVISQDISWYFTGLSFSPAVQWWTPQAGSSSFWWDAASSRGAPCTEAWRPRDGGFGDRLFSKPHKATEHQHQIDSNSNISN